MMAGVPQFMKVPLSWLRDYVDLPASVPQLADRLTLAGIELSRGDARLTPAEYEPLLAHPNPVAVFAGAMCRYLGDMSRRRWGWHGEAALPDAIRLIRGQNN